MIAMLVAGTIASYSQKLNEINHFSMDTLPWEKMADKVYRKYAYGSNTTVAYLKLYKGAFIPVHNHPNEQVTHILDGKVEVEMQGRKYIVSKGDVLIIPPNVPHSFIALENTLDMDVFSPIRMDWIKNTAGYFNSQASGEAKLEIVAEMPFRPGNVAVSATGEVFSTIHPLGNPSIQLVKVNPGNSYSAFPNASWQRKAETEATSKTFDTPLGIRVDSKNRVWIIDMGLNYGKTRLFAFDAKTGKKVYENIFPESVAPKGSFIQDLVIDDKNGFVYLADISNPGILVVNLANHHVRRLKSQPSFASEDLDIKIDGAIVNFGGKAARVAINPITLSSDNETLFFGAMNSKTWYKLNASLLRKGSSDDEIARSIQKESPKPISDGAATDTNGDHYFTNLNESGIDKWNAEMRTFEPVVRDARLNWPDNIALGPDGYIYVAVNQLHKTPAFTGTIDLGKAPYFIYKLKVKDL